jgi:cell shape-determining protein MreD
MSLANRQTLALLLGNAILVTVVAQTNHALASWQLRLWLGGAVVAPAALLVGHRAGVVAVFLTGLALDARAPVLFGAQALALLAAHAALFSMRDRLAREATPVRVAAALLTNLAAFLAFAAAAPSGTHGGRLITDLILSQFAVAALTPWAFALQDRLLAWLHARPGHSP